MRKLIIGFGKIEINNTYEILTNYFFFIDSFFNLILHKTILLGDIFILGGKSSFLIKRLIVENDILIKLDASFLAKRLIIDKNILIKVSKICFVLF